MTFEDADVISRYTRAEGIADGVLVDVTDMAKEAGITIPVAVTGNLYHRLVKPSEEDEMDGQSLEGRLRDILMIFRVKARKCDSSMAVFDVDFFSGGKTHTERLWVVIDGGDDGNPVITIMLPEDY
jgi:hypothetical protein